MCRRCQLLAIAIWEALVRQPETSPEVSACTSQQDLIVTQEHYGIRSLSRHHAQRLQPRGYSVAPR